jgi:tetratricopeptide (TPR) repeat protein
MAKEWYRKSSWSEADKADFFAHLKRSRSAFHKAQYLRIQAGHLQMISTPESSRAALQLLDKVLAEFPEQITEFAATCYQKAECLETLGDFAGAVEAYRNALEFERRYSNSTRTLAWLDFGCFAVRTRMKKIYDEVLAVLDEFKGRLMFPFERYKYFGILAMISEAWGDSATARDFARKALTAAAVTDSGFRYHPTVGLVSAKEKDAEIHRALEKLASA